MNPISKFGKNHPIFVKTAIVGAAVSASAILVTLGVLSIMRGTGHLSALKPVGEIKWLVRISRKFFNFRFQLEIGRPIMARIHAIAQKVLIVQGLGAIGLGACVGAAGIAYVSAKSCGKKEKDTVINPSTETILENPTK